MAIATLPECRRPTCHNLVAIGKNGEPLKDCETHRDKRPSSKARAAAKDAAETLLATGEEVPDDRFGDPATESTATPAPFGAPRPAPKPTSREKANSAISARLTVPEPVVALRADRNQVIVTLTAVGSTDAQSKAKYAARAAGHKITGVNAISGGANGSRKPSEWKVTLDLRAVKAKRAKPDVPVLADLSDEDRAARVVVRSEQKVHTRFHKGSGKYLAEAIVNGKHIFRYAADEESAAQKMRAHLATL